LAVAGNDIAQQASVNGQVTLAGMNEVFHLKHLSGVGCWACCGEETRTTLSVFISSMNSVAN
jgi:hypothetical protein